MPLVLKESGVLLTDGDDALASDTECCKCDKCKFYFYQNRNGTLGPVTMLRSNCSGTYAGVGPDTPIYVKRGEWSPQFIAAGYWDVLGNKTAFTGWYKNGTEKITSGDSWFSGCDTVVSASGSAIAISTDKTLADRVPPMPNYNSHPIVWAPNRLSVYCPKDGSLTTARFEARIENVYCIIKFTHTIGGTVTNGDKELHSPPSQTSTATVDEGYKFLGWVASGTDGESNHNIGSNPTITVGCNSNVSTDTSIRNNGPVTRTVTANFSKLCGKVTFTLEKPASWADVSISVPQNGIAGSYQTVTIDVAEDETVNATAVYSAGYNDPYPLVFAGWWKGTERVSTSATFKYRCDGGEENPTYTAKWSRRCHVSISTTYAGSCNTTVSGTGTNGVVPCGQSVTLSGSGGECSNGGSWIVEGQTVATGTSYTLQIPNTPDYSIRVTYDTATGCGCSKPPPEPCECQGKKRKAYKLIYHSAGTYNYDTYDCECKKTSHEIKITTPCPWTGGCEWPDTFDECIWSSKSPGPNFVYQSPGNPYYCGW